MAFELPGRLTVRPHPRSAAYAIVAEGDERPLALVWGPRTGEGDYPEAEDTARLMAAAPQLLEALRACYFSEDGWQVTAAQAIEKARWAV